MNILDFFEDENPEHVMAFAHYMITDEFPEGFLPEDIEFDDDWLAELLGVMAANYATAIAEKHGYEEYLDHLINGTKPTIN